MYACMVVIKCSVSQVNECNFGEANNYTVHVIIAVNKGMTFFVYIEAALFQHKIRQEIKPSVQLLS